MSKSKLLFIKLLCFLLSYIVSLIWVIIELKYYWFSKTHGVVMLLMVITLGSVFYTMLYRNQDINYNIREINILGTKITFTACFIKNVKILIFAYMIYCFLSLLYILPYSFFVRFLCKTIYEIVSSIAPLRLEFGMFYSIQLLQMVLTIWVIVLNLYFRKYTFTDTEVEQ